MMENRTGRYRIPVFISLAYGFSWLVWLPNVLGNWSGSTFPPSPWWHLLGGLGPLLSALLTTWIFGSRAGLRLFIGERFSLPSAKKWLWTGIGMPAAFFLFALLIDRTMTGSWLEIETLGVNDKLWTANPLLIWLTWILFFGLGEETGWRGFLFHALDKRYSSRTAALLVAPIWAAWHIPVFLYDKDFISLGLSGTIGWLFGLVCGSFLLGWLFKRSGSTLWPVILWHGTFNFFTSGDQMDDVFQAVMSMLVLAFVIFLPVRYDQDFLPGKRRPD